MADIAEDRYQEISVKVRSHLFILYDGRYLIDPFHYYTYKDYKSFPEDFRCELHNGKIYAMASPTEGHNNIAADIWFQLREGFRKAGIDCIVSVDTDVRFYAKDDESDAEVKRPDVYARCTGYKNGIVPSFIAEVLSPSTQEADLGEKKQLYEQAGVKEYWAVHSHRKIEIFLLGVDGAYHAELIEASPDEQIFEVSVRTVLGLTIKLDRVLFDNMPD